MNVLKAVIIVIKIVPTLRGALNVIVTLVINWIVMEVAVQVGI